MKVSIRKEINISSATIANELVENDDVLKDICINIQNILYDKYDANWESAEDAVNNLSKAELIEIIELMAKRMKED